MPTPLDAALLKAKISDSAFSGMSGLTRQQVWRYRQERKDVRGKTSVAILAALKKLGIRLAVEDLIPLPPEEKPKRPRKAA